MKWRLPRRHASNQLIYSRDCFVARFGGKLEILRDALPKVCRERYVPHLAPCADFTGQRWILTKTDKRVEGTASHPHDEF
jgi:hypothetical protein